DFRPDTKMPHYYGLSNNNEEALKGTGQELFPDAEIAGIAYYLFTESKDFLAHKDKFRKIDEDRIAELKETIGKLESKNQPFGQEQKELNSIQRRLELFEKPQKLAEKFAPLATALKDYKAKPENGRRLFSERGCLACHTHRSTMTEDGPNKLPALPSDAHFA